MGLKPYKAASGGGAHLAADQSEVAAFLAHPETHGVESVERIDTHGAMVFLAGDRAYKVKRAVDYPYMNFSTLERRRRACVKEVELNRRTAPDTYLGVAAITRDGDAGLRLGGAGAAVEWAVVMRRFDQDGLFDRLARHDGLTPELLGDLAESVARFHEQAEPVESEQGGLGWVIEENAEEFAEHPALFPAEPAEALTAAARAAHDKVVRLLEARRVAGLVRRCHGDLHLRNICLVEGRPTLFDAIEFNDRIAEIDVFYDLAFLLMDLDHRGLRREANLVLNRYLERRDTPGVLAALPLFLSLRAAVRAKVSASAALSQDRDEERARLEREARDYFAAAEAYLAPPPARVIAVGGYSGSGKTSLAGSLAPELGPAPGALVIRSDVTRKQLWGVSDLTRLPADAYRAEVSERVYRKLIDRARSALDADHAVVFDAVHGTFEERREAEAAAERSGVAFTGFWLEAPGDVLANRTAARRGDASDATPAVVREQLERDPGPVTWHRLDASRPPEEVAAAARALL